MATKTIFLAEYKKYSSDENNKTVRIAAAMLDAALKKAHQIVRRSYASRVVSLTEEITGVYVA